MALPKRIIPCLDIKNGTTVKGTNFLNTREIGDPVQLADHYIRQGADELVFLDITATDEKRKTLSELVKKIAARINIPFTVGGGIDKIEDVHTLLNAGADKVSINSAAVRQPELIYTLARQFGSQCVVIAIDTKFENGNWLVYINSGKQATGLTVTDWVKKCISFGAGEILLTSIDHDGTKNGFACNLINNITSLASVPIIASGGAGRQEHFEQVFINGADAALAASVFHKNEILIPDLKQFLNSKNISVRI